MDVILYYLASSIAVIIVMTIMGFTRAYISYKLGDVTIKNMGKVSLNPKKHFEILGFISFLFFDFGWCAPIEISSLYYKNRKKGNVLVFILPLIVAIILAFIFNFIHLLIIRYVGSLKFISIIEIILYTIPIYFINFAIFNIIPVYPLFGQKFFQAVLPANKAIKLLQYEKFIQILVMFLLISGLLQRVLNIISSFILNIISIPIQLILGFI